VARTRRAAAHTVRRKSTAARSGIAVFALQGRHRKVGINVAKIGVRITDTTTTKRLKEVAFLEEEEKDEMKHFLILLHSKAFEHGLLYSRT
jgi:hypothetical protein